MANGDSEPGAARARMVDELRSSGRLASAALEEAFRAVPRHVFLPEIGAADAYTDRAFVIKTDVSGLPLSSSSQPMMMAIMLEQLGIAPGDRVLEVGAGTGYNTALMARLAGEQGLVVTMDIDPGLVARARANLAAAQAAAGGAAAEVIAICGDGGFGAPDYAPYDKIIVTVGAWDVPPQWLAQLGPRGRIVLPLSVRGSQLSVALERADGHWRSRSIYPCGFIRMTGAFGSPESFVPLGPQPGMHVQADDGRWLDTGALYAALTGPAADVPTGVRVAGLARLFEADLWITLTEPDLVRLTIAGGAPLRHAMLGQVPPFGAMAGSGATPRPGSVFAVAGLWPAGLPERPPRAVAGAEKKSARKTGQEKAGTDMHRELSEYLSREFEVTARGFGPGGADLAGRLARQVAAWQDAGRPGASGLTLAVYPAGTAVTGGPGQVVLDRRHARLVLAWSPGLHQ
jgi:protein-L-isoaspartate(D-aspartate) O-methyltransferase